MSTQEDTLLFQAEIIPYRSLSRRGLRMLIGSIVLASTSIGVALFFLGAWPATGFCGLEVGLAVLLLRANARQVRQSECLLLSESHLRVVRRQGRAHEEQVLSPDWLRVDLEEPPGRVPRLFLANRGRRLEVARSLGEAEKRDLADALRTALHRRRHPIFDNPQLREG